MALKVGILVKAKKEIILNAGEFELNPAPKPKPKTDPNTPIFLNLGEAEADEICLSGPGVDNPDDLAESLELAYYFDGEESAEKAKPIDLKKVTVVKRVLPRQKAEPGWRWRFRLETRSPFEEKRIYETGFQPPFKNEDVVLYVDNLINYGYDGYYLAGVDFGHKSAGYIETDWAMPVLLSEGELPD